MDTIQLFMKAKTVFSTISISFTLLGTLLYIFTLDEKMQKNISIIIIALAIISFIVLRLTIHSNKGIKNKDIKISNIKSLIEREKLAKEVWVITPALNMDVMSTMANGEFKRAIEDNIKKKGVEYRYIAPNTQNIRKHILKYKKEYGTHIKSKQFLLLPDSEFINFFNEVVIYDPNSNEKSSFVYPPSIMDIYEDVLEIDIHLTLKYITKFREIWEGEEEKPSSEQRFC